MSGYSLYLSAGSLWQANRLMDAQKLWLIGAWVSAVPKKGLWVNTTADWDSSSFAKVLLEHFFNLAKWYFEPIYFFVTLRSNLNSVSKVRSDESHSGIWKIFFGSNKSFIFWLVIFWTNNFWTQFCHIWFELGFQLNFLGFEGLDLTVTFVHTIFVTFL